LIFQGRSTSSADFIFTCEVQRIHANNASKVRMQNETGEIGITVLCIIKFTPFPFIFHFRSGSGKVKFCHYFTMLCNIQEGCT